MEQIVDPVSRGSLPGSLPGQGSSFSHSPTGVDERADEPGEGVLRTFPQYKKSAKLGSRSGSELLPDHAACSAGGLRRVGAAQGEKRWARRTSGTDVLTVQSWRAPAGVEVVWYGEKDEEGGVWYWHRDTRVSTFDLPPLPPE